jgi:thiamine-monophosphate kinase
VPLKEKLLIERIRRAAGRGSRSAGVGIGDDCAVLRLPRGHEVLVTTDFSLEDVHFRREWHPADSVGHRCLARGLSDIAAMGGVPRAAFLSLALPPELPQKWVDQFVSGLLKLAKRYSVPLAGGDTAQSPAGILADIVVLGSAPVGKAVLRSGAKPGDLLYVTGTLGSSVAALNRLRDGETLKPKSHPKHFYPEPRIAVGQFLREKKLVSAMIDISDGLSTDLGHICDESKAGAVVYAEALPMAGCQPEARDNNSPGRKPWVGAGKRFESLQGRRSERALAFGSKGAYVNAALSRAEHQPTPADSKAHFVSEHGLSRAVRQTRLVSGHDFSRAENGPIESGALAPEGNLRDSEPLFLALHGGEEYELLFTARPNRHIPKQIAGVPITQIGEIVGGKQMKLAKADGRTEILRPAGWEHFG